VQDAVTQYRAALSIEPGSAELHNNLGVALGRLGRTEESVSHFENALKLKPDYKEARANLTRALHSRDRLRNSRMPRFPSSNCGEEFGNYVACP
jgi:Flp pilus assembly protein TadD